MEAPNTLGGASIDGKKLNCMRTTSLHTVLNGEIICTVDKEKRRVKERGACSYRC